MPKAPSHRVRAEHQHARIRPAAPAPDARGHDLRRPGGEPERVLPPDPALVEAALPFMSRQVRALVELQLATGAQPGELVSMHAVDIDTESLPVDREWSVGTRMRGKTLEVPV